MINFVLASTHTLGLLSILVLPNGDMKGMNEKFVVSCIEVMWIYETIDYFLHQYEVY